MEVGFSIYLLGLIMSLVYSSIKIYHLKYTVKRFYKSIKVHYNIYAKTKKEQTRRSRFI